MAIVYEDVNPTLIENTNMQRCISNGVHTVYLITPIDGYVLHDKSFDSPVYDEITQEETGEVILGYRKTTASCAASYNFATNPREFYAVTEGSVPADQIFGGGDNDHEVM